MLLSLDERQRVTPCKDQSYSSPGSMLTDSRKQQELSFFFYISANDHHRRLHCTTGVPRNFVWGGGQQIQLRIENGDLGAVAPYPLAKDSGGSCNLIQEISFHIVKVS